MDAFFKVWDRARKLYDLERLVKVNFDEAKIRIIYQGQIIVRADGEYTELEIMYTQAAQRLATWLQQKGA
ncbi:MAG: hypothetical protein J6Y02_21285 [Pseudobutyrivibrio sp.]|nr:hypothetical protein [Pseudobutyrivibrio sp.]